MSKYGVLSEIRAYYSLVKPVKKIHLNIAPRENARISVCRERSVNCKKGNFDDGEKKKIGRRRQQEIESDDFQAILVLGHPQST